VGLAACGGGGGGGAPEALPRLQAVTHQGTSGIRDNETGIIWAAKLGAENLPQLVSLPTAAELLQLADLGEQILQNQFGFLLSIPSPLVRASDQVIGDGPIQTAWGVDFGARKNDPGGLSNENPNNTLSLYVLSRPSAAKLVSYTANYQRGIVETDELMWKLCSEGSQWTGSTCDKPATPMTGTAALAQGNWGSFAGYSDWRLPTKKELQGLLQLSINLSAAPSLLPVQFDRDAVASKPLYWSSTRGSDPSWAWQVDFSVGLDPGGVELGPLADDFAYIRLVRSR
jgi:hypothetical protein